MGFFSFLRKSKKRRYVLTEPVSSVSDVRDWTQDLATLKQVRYLAEFGFHATHPRFTKGQAGEMLDELIGEHPKIAAAHERAKAARPFDEVQELKDGLVESERQLAAARGAGNIEFHASEVRQLRAELRRVKGASPLSTAVSWILFLSVCSFVYSRCSQTPAPPVDSKSSAPTPIPENRSTVVAPNTPAKSPATPALPSANPVAVAEAKRLAVKRYPALGIANSPFNTEFLARYKRYQSERTEYFNDPAWPLKLADECATALRAKETPR